MSLKTFHRVFIVVCLALFAFLGAWASGRNPSALVTPWLQAASVAGVIGMASYLVWHIRSIRLPA
jgi:hypothetical protein